jgi:ATP-dependent RNA helicase DDX23/PRP28
MTTRDWRIFKENFDIITKGKDIPCPLRNWKDLRQFVPDQIVSNIHRMGFEKPTPIQMQAIPVGAGMRDMLALAPTGSGKSAAFLLPIISFLMKMPPVDGSNAEDGPYSLIMAPTRELAI